MTVRNDFAARPVDALLATLDGVHPSGTDKWTARCPAHDDDRNSLSVALSPEGKILLHCHAGCPYETIREAVSGALPKPGRASPPKRATFGPATATYDYTDENGVLLLQVQRDALKNFRQRRPSHLEPPADSWLYDVATVRKIPYRLPDVLRAVADSAPVYVVEGEKDADALAALGLVATTNAGGAGKWGPEHAAALEGAELVVVLPDNDEPGVRHARIVRSSLRGKVGHVRIVRLPGLPEKGDASDWLAAGGTRAALEDLAQAAPKPEGWTSALKLLESDMPDVNWLIPNVISRPSIAVLSGWSGAYKSWVALDLALQAAVGGKFAGRYPLDPPMRVMYLTADEDAAEVRRKLLMLRAGAALNGTSDALLNENLVLWIEPLDLTEERAFGKLLDAVADYTPALIVMDHLRLVLPGEENSSDYARSLKERCAAITAEHPCAVLLLHHWRKVAKERELNAPGQRARGTGALRGVMDHHLCIERDDFGAATFIVEKNRKGQEPPPFSFTIQFADHEGMAAIQYVGAVADHYGEPSVADRVMALLEECSPRPMTQAELTARLAGKASRSAVRKAITVLVRDEKVVTRKEKKELLVAIRRYAQDLLAEAPAPVAPSGTLAVPLQIVPQVPYKDDD